MQTILRRMTLQSVLKRHGIDTLKEFIARTGFSRQHAWNLWNGYTGVGKGTAKTLEERLGIPYDELMRIRPVPRSKRYRQEPPEPE
jgi:transcriptional regulator with XRE-family HTH domain